MKFTEFEPIWKTICKYYSKPEFLNDKEMIRVYFDEMKHINSNFEKFEQLLYRKCQFFPKTYHILEIRKAMMDEMLEEQRVNINEPVCECKLCNGTGYRIIRDNRMQQYAVACDCKNGDTKIYDGRNIQDKMHRSIYIVPRYSQMFPENVKEETA